MTFFSNEALTQFIEEIQRRVRETDGMEYEVPLGSVDVHDGVVDAVTALMMQSLTRLVSATTLRSALIKVGCQMAIVVVVNFTIIFLVRAVVIPPCLLV